MVCRRHNFITVDPGLTEEQMTAGLRIDDLEWVSGLDRPYSKVEVHKTQGISLVSSEA